MDKIKKSEFLADFYCSECAAVFMKEFVTLSMKPPTSAPLVDFAERLWESIEAAMEDEPSGGGNDWPPY